MITIKIEAEQGTGKTMLGREIFDYLSSKGYSISFTDNRITLLSKGAIRQKNLGGPIPIKIVTKQVA